MLHWQLQHRRALTFAQLGQQHDRSVRKLKGIMMDVWPALVHLLELRHRMPSLLRFNHHQESSLISSRPLSDRLRM
jgi:hypothetical protein